MTEVLQTLAGLPAVESISSTVSNGSVKHYLVRVRFFDDNVKIMEQLESIWPFCSVKLEKGIVVAEYMVRPSELEAFIEKVLQFDLFKRNSILKLRFNGFDKSAPFKEVILTCNFNGADKDVLERLVAYYESAGDRVVRGNDLAEIFIETHGKPLGRAIQEKAVCLAM